MKCPECGTENTQQLLVSYLCPNKNCKNYDVRQDTVKMNETLKELQSQLQMVKTEDPLDSAMKEFLQRKLLIG